MKEKPDVRYCEYAERAAYRNPIRLVLSYIPLHWRSGQGHSAPRLR